MAVHMAPGFAGGAGDMPATHARILWDNLQGDISATSEQEGFPAARAGTVDTVSWWKPTVAPATWTVDYTTARTVDSFGVAAHELSGVLVTIQAKISSVWTTVLSFTPADNSAILALFPAVTCTAMRITIGAVARIGVIYTGSSLAMLRRGYTNLGMVTYNRQSVLTSYVSEGGQLLARFMQRRGLKGRFQWDHLPEDWYGANFDPFTLAAQTQPFFVAARPSGYPEDCAYMWVDQVIVPQRMGIRNWVTVSFDALGHADA